MGINSVIVLHIVWDKSLNSAIKVYLMFIDGLEAKIKTISTRNQKTTSLNFPHCDTHCSAVTKKNQCKRTTQFLTHSGNSMYISFYTTPYLQIKLFSNYHKNWNTVDNCGFLILLYFLVKQLHLGKHGSKGYIPPYKFSGCINFCLLFEKCLEVFWYILVYKWGAVIMSVINIMKVRLIFTCFITMFHLSIIPIIYNLVC